MKKHVLLLFAGMLAFWSAESGAIEVKSSESKTTLSQKVEIYYFHFTRRCVTCKAVEAEAKIAIEAMYPDQVKNGLVSFIEVNLDNEDSKPAVEKAKAEGQGLIIVKGDKRIDLTTQGFMYAVSNPERLRNEIRKAVDAMLNSK